MHMAYEPQFWTAIRGAAVARRSGPSWAEARVHKFRPKLRVISVTSVTTENGEYKIVEGLDIDAFSQERINKTLAELQGEQDGVKHLL